MPQDLHEEHHEKLKSLLRRLIRRGTKRHFILLFEKYHEADIAEAVEELEIEWALRFFRLHSRIEFESLKEVFLHVSSSFQVELMAEFSQTFALRLLKEIESDDAASLLSDLTEKDLEYAETLMSALPKSDVMVLKGMMAQEDSAGAMMSTEFISIPENLTVREALKYFRELNPPDSDTSYYIFVVDEHNHLVGETTLRNLIMAKGSVPVRDVRDDYPTKALVTMDQEEVASMFERYDLVVLPVVDEDDHLEGIITVDDIVDVVIEEATEDIYKLSGTTDVEEEKLLEGSIVYPISSRLPWLIVTVMGGLLASFLITKYSGIYTEKWFSLALSLSFVPLLMGLGGTVGNQSSTIIVRGISTGVVRDSKALQFIGRELLVGLSMGIIVALVFALFSYVIGNALLVTGIVAAALFINISVATLFGSLLPILFKKADIDPAVASAPFISSTLDITGQLIYFSLTLLIIRFFGG